jgi:hypothetical protein
MIALMPPSKKTSVIPGGDPLGTANNLVSLALSLFSAIGIINNARFIPALQALGWPVLTLISVAVTLLVVWLIGLISNNYTAAKRTKAFNFIIFGVCLILFGAPVVFKQASDPKNLPFEKWAAQPKTAVVNKQFVNEAVHLDGKSFHNCNFEHVTLLYDGNAPFDLVSCNFAGAFVADFGADPRFDALVKLMELSGALNTNKFRTYPR